MNNIKIYKSKKYNSEKYTEVDEDIYKTSIIQFLNHMMMIHIFMLFLFVLYKNQNTVKMILQIQ